MIEVKDLTKKYGQHTAIDHLTFHVEEGQIYGFLGPNGAGKTTTMNIMTGYLAATDGTVTINGKDIQKEPEAAKCCIGYLPEQPPVYMDMTVNEYLKFVAELKRIPRAERAAQIKKAREMTWITDVQDRLIKNLSKGYRQRVGLAQAILGDPEVIILDEPTVGLDPKQIIEIRDLIRSLGKEHTVILSSHILSEVSEICDQIMIISNGKLVASDTPAGLQELVGGAEELELEVKGSFAEVSAALSDLPQVDSVTDGGDLGNGSVRVIVTAKGKADIREELFARLVERHLMMLSMKQNQKSLEEIFLELTGEVPRSVDDPMERKRRKKARKAARKNKKDEEKDETVSGFVSKEKMPEDTREAASESAASGKVDIAVSEDETSKEAEAAASEGEASKEADVTASEDETSKETEAAASVGGSQKAPAENVSEASKAGEEEK